MFKVVALGASGVLLLAGGGFGINHLLQKDITMTVDGVSQNLTVYSSTVGGVLASEDISLGEHDVVSPSPETEVSDGQEISIRYGREITATIDGVPTKFWTTALTVDEAIQQLNVRSHNIGLSTSRSTQIGREGLDIKIDSLFDVMVDVGGKKQSVKIAGTVANALTAANVTVDPDDVVTPPVTTELKDGMAIKVVKVEQKTSTKNVAIPFTTKTEKSGSLTKGETKVKVKGQDGTKVETWVVRIEDGKPVKQTMSSSKVTKEPVQEVKLEGTKAKKATQPSATKSASSSSSSSSKSSKSSKSSSSSSSASSSSNLSPATANTCQASYYGQGQRTANGESFNPNDFTAAHKTLAFGTRVKVTNPANGKTTVVRINDRGPFISGRCLDLSTAAMSAIGGTSSGVITVNWQVV